MQEWRKLHIRQWRDRLVKVDARLDATLPQHPKTKRLIKRLGADGAWSLVKLIVWTVQNRSDGDLSGMSDEDIELAVDWAGTDGELIAALAEVGFLDGEESGRSLHDWAVHQPYASGAAARSHRARWNATKGHHGAAEADRLVPEWAAIRTAQANNADAGSISASTATSMLPAQAVDADRNAPSPSPLPSPLPKQTRPARTPRKSPVRSLPGDFSVSPAIRAWAGKGGFGRLDERLAHFVGWAKASGKQYADWDQAFQNAIRDDWAKLNGTYGPGVRQQPKAPATAFKTAEELGL